MKEGKGNPGGGRRRGGGKSGKGGVEQRVGEHEGKVEVTLLSV